MARIVLVHGIGQQGSSVDEQEKLWCGGLADTVAVSGYPDASRFAAELRRVPEGTSDPIARMAFYAELFRPQDVQGLDESDSPAAAAVAEELARALLERAAASLDDRTAAEARAELRQADPDPEEPQAGRHVRTVIAALDGNRFLSSRIFGIAQRARPNLAQVARYLTDDDLRTRALRTVSGLLDADTAVVIGHSLGSVVAWEACRTLRRPLPLLITLGSPLGLDGIIYPRLRPQPPVWPPAVRRWVNVAHANDAIAVEPALHPMFPAPDDRRIEDHLTSRPGDQHGIIGYLEEQVVARALLDTLEPSAAGTAPEARPPSDG